MKKFNSLLALAIVVAGFSSCTKEDQTLDPKDSNNVLEFFNQVPDLIASPTTSTVPLYEGGTFAAVPGQTQDFAVTINYAGSGAAPQDISVELAAAPEAVVTYNTENSESFTALPSSLYELTSWNVTIPSGKKQAVVTFKLKTADFDFTESYVLALKIKSASYGVISKNYGTMLFTIGAKNKYDGIYTMSATAPLVDHTVTTIVGWYPIKMQLITQTANSVALYDGINYVNAYGHPIKNGTSNSYYGSFSPEFSFDNNGVITDVVNAYGQLAATQKRSGFLVPTGVNKATFKADGSVESFEVSYMMTEGTAYTPRTYFTEKFVYSGPR